MDEPPSAELINKVETLIKETLRKNMKEIDGALIKPLSPDYPLAQTVYIF